MRFMNGACRAAWRGQPVGQARGMSLHECQSLLMEMQACRSRGFLSLAAPLHRRRPIRGRPLGWDAETLYRHRCPGPARASIRVDADEVTYPAHVILRYRLEKALIDGETGGGRHARRMEPRACSELLGLTPPDDRLGCLQDIHWYDGAFGYFPTYTLGAMTAAQLFAAAAEAVPDVRSLIAEGDFRPLLAWLRRSVHSQGSRLTTDDLLTKATGRPLDTAVFKDHLRRRYLA